MIKNILFIIIFFIAFMSGAQTPADRALISTKTNQNSADQLDSYLYTMKVENEIKVKQFYQANPSAKNVVMDSESPKWLERIDRYGQPVFLTTYNFGGSLTIGSNHLYSGGSLNLDIEGQGMTAIILDGGYARETHEEFSARVVYGEPREGLSDHATHVGGTIISSGSNISLRGIAPQGSLISYYFDDDSSEMRDEAANGYLVSNHSYGREVSETTDVAVFGKYDSSAAAFDFITQTYPYFLPVVSAGNDRGQGLNSSDRGYDLLTDRTLSKNVLTVGAVGGVFNYSEPDDVEMSSFSSFGPTDDGRIKPEIVAKGVSVTSLGSASDSDTGVKSGTSMSAPMVTGGIMLLQQLFNQEQSFYMRSSTVRALVTLTANEAGDDIGPDYRFGFGLMDVEKAAQLILNLNETSLIEENTLLNDATETQTISTKGSEKLSVSISWIDPLGTLPGDEEDDPQPVVNNDLDLKLIAEDGTEFFPYKLDPSDPTAPATNGINDVDNIELIEIDAPSGNYDIVINHKGSLRGNRQNYSLVVNGATKATASTSSEEIAGLSMFPNPANDFVNITFNATSVSNSVTIQLYNTLGQMVKNESFNNNGRFNQRVNISDLRSGVYFVAVSDGNLKSTRKLIVK